MTPLKKALEHEKLVTASIDAIYAAAYEAKDFRAMQMLDWFMAHCLPCYTQNLDELTRQDG